MCHMVCMMHSPQVGQHLSINMLFFTWFACILHMLDIMSPYAALHMVCMHSPHVGRHVSIYSSPHGLHDILHMVCMHSPHVGHHVSICCSPHGLHDILHMLDNMSPYAALHMVCMTFSTCCTSCLHMLFSTWFARHSPHVVHHVSICCSPHGWSVCVLMLICIYHEQCKILRTHCDKA